jgi:hypothetical protein
MRFGSEKTWNSKPGWSDDAIEPRLAWGMRINYGRPLRAVDLQLRNAGMEPVVELLKP